MTTFHCLFEQSGTFKNVFKSHGHQAYDYDILNDYGQTDFQIDLFQQIEIEYEKITVPFEQSKYSKHHKTIFTSMKPETDFIIAFFPCTYFSDLNEMLFQGFNGVATKPINAKKIQEIIERNQIRTQFFEIWLKFCFICDALKIPTIIENPHGQMKRNFVKLYSPYKPKYVEKDRSKWGDKFIKDTLFWGINFDFKEEFYWYDKEYEVKGVITDYGKGKERSEITPRYAENFYKRFIEHAITKPETELAVIAGIEKLAGAQCLR